MKNANLPLHASPPTGFVLDPRSLSALKNRASQNQPESIKELALEFEGIFMQMMLKSMRATTSQDSFFESDQTRFMTSILDQQMGYELGKKGTLGFAKAMTAQMLRTLPGASQSASVLGLDEEDKANTSDLLGGLSANPLDVLR